MFASVHAGTLLKPPKQQHASVAASIVSGKYSSVNVILSTFGNKRNACGSELDCRTSVVRVSACFLGCVTSSGATVCCGDVRIDHCSASIIPESSTSMRE